MTNHANIAGMSPGDYAELVDNLRKDLQLDATVDVLPGTIQAALIDQAGQSLFLQQPKPALGTISWGVVKGDGTAITGGSMDWSSNRLSVGAYTLTWTTKKHGTPVVIATVIETGSGASVRCTSVPNSTGVSISTITAAGAPDDDDFSFVAIG